jgi:excisionase family DNA binding protein
MATRRNAAILDSSETGTELTISPGERAKARELSRVIDRSGGPVTVSRGDQQVELPGVFVDLIRSVAGAASAGAVVDVVHLQQRVTVVLRHSPAGSDGELTSQEVADVLNVSRPHVVKLARTGVLPHRMVGNRHRFREDDVLAYQQRTAEAREKALAELAPVLGYVAADF